MKYTLNLEIFGLENLALIPGCIGSAAIQNIGAYGLEFKDICSYVDVLFLNDYTFKRINANLCQFSYRNSIFKNQYKDYFIISVGIKLLKAWKPTIFSTLQKYIQKKDITAEKIFDIICKIRKSKLPNPKLTGNAGSFFKNPIIQKKKAYEIVSLYKTLYYPQKNGLVKISGSELIQKCQFNNIQIGGAAIHDTQKLILINKKNASSKELLKIAKIIHACILKKFDIFLNPEVDFIGSKRKINPLKIFSKNTKILHQ